MLKIIKNKSIFESTCDALVNPVNCVGVMGKGLALEMKRRFPEMFEAYRETCFKGHVHVGKTLMYPFSKPKILLFPTKSDWRYNSNINYIKEGLHHFADTYQEHNISSIAFPLLGCGCGSLDPDTVLDVMKEYLEPLNDLYIEIYDNRAGVTCEVKTPSKTLEASQMSLFDTDDIIVEEEDEEALEVLV